MPLSQPALPPFRSPLLLRTWPPPPPFIRTSSCPKPRSRPPLGWPDAPCAGDAAGRAVEEPNVGGGRRCH
eukprot:9005704-Alexandrium_andersonii.AAC.1